MIIRRRIRWCAGLDDEDFYCAQSARLAPGNNGASSTAGFPGFLESFPGYAEEIPG
jgi:hypothetical protein